MAPACCWGADLFLHSHTGAGKKQQSWGEKKERGKKGNKKKKEKEKEMRGLSLPQEQLPFRCCKKPQHILIEDTFLLLFTEDFTHSIIYLPQK